MSRQRQAARAQRDRRAAQQQVARTAEQRRAAGAKARRERRTMAWRRVRLWQHGPGFRRNRERWGALATLMFTVLLLVYLYSRSIGALIVTALALIVCAPVLVLLFVDRRPR